MHPRAPKLLEDIHNAADFVKTSTHGVALEQFQQHRLLRQAVERSRQRGAWLAGADCSGIALAQTWGHKL